MEKQKKGETFIGIMIGLVILSFIALGVVNIVGINLDISNNYEKLSLKNLIDINTDNIIKKLDLSGLYEGDKFFIYKNESNKEFEILSFSGNESYKYIDVLGNKQENLDDYRDKTFSRTLEVSKDVVKYIREPDSIDEIILHLDASDLSGNGGYGFIPTNGEKVGIWHDIIGTEDASQNHDGSKPTYSTGGINGYPAINFNGGRFYNINDHTKINRNNLDNYPERSYSIVLKTGDDINTTQVIYEEGGRSEGQDGGYNLMINNGKIYFLAWNDRWDTDHKYKSVEIGDIIVDTVYYIAIVQNSKTSDDTQNELSIYLNGELKSSINHIDKQYEHYNDIGLGGVSQNTRNANNPYGEINGGNRFKGHIGEFIIWNHALNDEEILGVQNYLSDKWKINFNTVPKLNIIKKEIKPIITN